jgi:hypothetical protein
MKRLFRGTRQGSQSPSAKDTTTPEQDAARAPSGSQAGQSALASDPAVHSAQQDLLPDAEIAPRAYAIWQLRGGPEGTHRDDWFEAERQLRNERGANRAPTHTFAADQAREAEERRKAQNAAPTIRDRMVATGRGNQQAGRGKS